MGPADEEQRHPEGGAVPTAGAAGHGTGGVPPGGAVTGPGARDTAEAPDAEVGHAEVQPPDAEVQPPEGMASVAAGGARELGGADAPAEQWDSFGVRADTVEGWKALGFGPFEAALAQGDGYGPESARHLARTLVELASTWRHVGMASAQGLRWHRAGFEAREAARLEDQGVTLERALADGGGHRLAG